MSKKDSGRQTKKEYSLTPEAREQRLAASSSAAEIKRLATDINIMETLEKLSRSTNKMSEDELDKLPYKDKIVAIGILYDKLYRGEKDRRQIQAIQINITPPEGSKETLNLQIDPNINSGAIQDSL